MLVEIIPRYIRRAREVGVSQTLEEFELAQGSQGEVAAPELPPANR